MRIRNLFFMLAILFTFCHPGYAQMMQGSVGVKVDYINFPADELDDADANDAVYVALEAYKALMGGMIQVGGEIGYAKADGSVRVSGRDLDSEFKFVPVEMNAKFSSGITDRLSYAIGLGISMIFVDFDSPDFGFDEDNWLWGGQLFGELNYTLGNVILGLDVKWHQTESFKDVDFNNYRAGAHIGWMF